MFSLFYAYVCMFQDMPGCSETALPNGLIAGHAYSITDVRTVSGSVMIICDLVLVILISVDVSIENHM